MVVAYKTKRVFLRQKTFGIICVLAGILSVGTGCMADMESSLTEADSGDTWPPRPVKDAIIPLGTGYSWEFINTNYDTAEVPLPQDIHEKFTIAIGDAYGVTIAGSLVLLDESTWGNKQSFQDTVFEYDMVGMGRGPLLTYSEPVRHPEISVAGLYVMGWFDNDSAWLYDEPKLRMAYPASEGTTWLYTDNDGDSVRVTFLSSAAQLYLPNDPKYGGALGFMDCQLYKEEIGSTVYYRYYDDKYGELGGLEYRAGKRVRSYYLHEFNEFWGYD